MRQQELTQAETQLTQITQEKENLQAQLDQTNLSKADTVLKASQSGILHVSDEFEGKRSCRKAVRLQRFTQILPKHSKSLSAITLTPLMLVN